MIKKLARSLREFKKDSILSPVFVSLEVLMEVLIPMLMASIIDNGIEQGNMTYIWQLGIVLVLASILSLFFGVLSGRFAAKASAGFAKNLRKDMFSRIQQYSFTNIDKFSNASLVTRLTTDITNVQMAFMMIVRVAVRGPIMLIFAVIFSVQLNAELSLIYLVAIPVLGAGLFWITWKAHPRFEKVFRSYDSLNRVVQENVTAMRVVKAYVREDHENKKFHRISDRVYNLFVSAEKLVCMNTPLMMFAMYTCITLICLLGGQQIIAGDFTTGQLLSQMTYATQILSSLMMLSMVFVMIIMARTSAERIVEVLDEESALKDPADPVEEVPNGSIDFNQVNFSYIGDKEKLALAGVDLHIKSGETVGIIGGTGSAKSTLVQLIPRLYDATEGSVLVGGIDVRQYGLEALRKQVAMVLQKNVLFAGSIKDNLRWGKPDATDEEIVHACKLAQADEFIQGFPDGYDTHIEQGGSNVSGGQKQRLCIARALLAHPKILILDDSTSAVDTRTDALIRKAFAEEIPGTTKLIIAQRINSVENADRVIVLDNGRVDAFDTPENLLKTNKIYREVYQSQGGTGAEDHE